MVCDVSLIWWKVDFHHKGQVIKKVFPCYDIFIRRWRSSLEFSTIMFYTNPIYIHFQRQVLKIHCYQCLASNNLQNLSNVDKGGKRCSDGDSKGIHSTPTFTHHYIHWIHRITKSPPLIWPYQLKWLDVSHKIIHGYKHYTSPWITLQSY